MLRDADVEVLNMIRNNLIKAATRAEGVLYFVNFDVYESYDCFGPDLLAEAGIDPTVVREAYELAREAVALFEESVATLVPLLR